MALIEQLMKTRLVTAAPDETVHQAAERMARNEVGAVLVVDGDRLVGMLSERDVLGRVVVEKRDAEKTRVAEVMTRDPVAVAADTHVRECVELIRAHGFRHLPVTRDGVPIGVLSTRDFQAHVVSGLESFIDDARYREKLAEGVDPYDHVGGSYAR